MSNVDFANIPDELKLLKQWCLYRLEDIGSNKPSKTPYQPNGELFNVNDPNTYSTFEEVIFTKSNPAQNIIPYSGIGFCFTSNDPYCFIDLDDTNGDSVTIDRQLKIFKEFDSYAEVSPSGKGLHIIIRGSIPSGRRRSSIEIYSSQRYATMTGNVHNASPIVDYQDKLTMLYEQMGSGPATLVYTGDEKEIHDDKQIIDVASKAINGEKFTKLLLGNWVDLYPSQSEADFAFMDMLAFYTKNKDQLTRIFRQSPLGARKKAKRNDYIDRMINRSFDRMLPPIDIDGFKIALERFTNGANNISTSVSNKHNSSSLSNNGILAGSSSGKTTAFEAENAVSITAPATKINTPFKLEPPPGLMGEIARFIYEASPRQVPEIAIAGAIGLMAGICGKAYNISATGLNQYVILIASTGAGKESCASSISKLMKTVALSVPTARHFIGPSHISSGQALAKYINTNPCFVSIIGEFGIRLQSMSDPRAHGPEKQLLANMLDLYNKSGHHQSYEPIIYSDKEKNIGVTQAPAFSLLAESTPETFFQVLNEDMILAGLLPRFLIVEYKGKVPYLNENAQHVEPWLSLVDSFSSLLAQCEMIMHSHRVIEVKCDEEATIILRRFQKDCTDTVNAENKDFMKHLWSRAHMKTLRVSALIAVGVNSIEPLVIKEYVMWATGLVVNDIRLLSERFEQGEIGSSTSELKQLQHLRAVVKEYIGLEWEKAEKYKVPKNLFDDKIVTGAYLSRRLAAQTSFRNDRLGSTIALKRAIQALIDADVIRELGKTELANKYGTTQKAFVITNVKGLGD